MQIQGSLTIDGVLLVPIEAYTFSVTGAVAVATGKSRIYLEGDYVVETVRAAVNTAPTGASLIVDVNKSGTTIYTTQSARPQIAASANSATGNDPAVTTFTALRLSDRRCRRYRLDCCRGGLNSDSPAPEDFMSESCRTWQDRQAVTRFQDSSGPPRSCSIR